MNEYGAIKRFVLLHPSAKWWDVFFQIPWCFLLSVFLLQNEVQGGDFNDCLECLPGNLENLIQFDTHLFVWNGLKPPTSWMSKGFVAQFGSRHLKVLCWLILAYSRMGIMYLTQQSQITSAIGVCPLNQRPWAENLRFLGSLRGKKVSHLVLESWFLVQGHFEGVI